MNRGVILIHLPFLHIFEANDINNPGVCVISTSSSTFKWGETGGSETPSSRTFYSPFPPTSIGVPASLYFYYKVLCNIFPVSAMLGILLFPFLLLPPVPLTPPPPPSWVLTSLSPSTFKLLNTINTKNLEQMCILILGFGVI